MDAAGQILLDSGVGVLNPGEDILAALSHIDLAEAQGSLRRWLTSKGATALAYSYRLDPGEGFRLFSLFMDFLSAERLLIDRGGQIRAVFFAGLPETCALVLSRYPSLSGVFRGGETALETLDVFGLDRRELPSSYTGGLVYDESRLAFGRELIRRGDYLSVGPVDRSPSPHFGRRGDNLAGRAAYGKARGLPPLMISLF